MNEMRRHDPEAEEVARIKEVVARRPLPDFVVGFDVRAGWFQDDPAVWITFSLTGDDTLENSEMERRASILVPLHDAVHADLAMAGIDRFPFFRAHYAPTTHR